MPEQTSKNPNGEAPLLKAKIRCVCTSKLKPGELPVDENEVDEKDRTSGVSDPCGEALQAVISKNAATR